MHKHAEMGVGTLIVFIAMLLVAAVAAGVLIQTASSLQEKSLTTGQQAKAQISTNAEVIEISATDGRDTFVNTFSQLVKLSPGSDPIKLDQVIFTFNTINNTATLKYRGTSGVCTKSNSIGYNTWTTEIITDVVNDTVNHYTLEEDLDDDAADDYIYLDGAEGDQLIVSLSSLDVPINVSLSIAFNMTNFSVPQSIDIEDVAITDGTTVYGYVTLSGSVYDNYTLPNNMTFEVDPYLEGQGYFAVEYEQEGTNNVAGNLQRGDVIKLCYEAPRNIGQDELLRINLIPKIGTSSLVEFVTPDVISTERVYLYP